MKYKRVYLTCFAIHFGLLIAVSCRETFWILGNGPTIFPSSLERYWKKAESVALLATGQGVAVPKPVRQTLLGYEHMAGIEVGYGFFAPNITDSYKLVFELHYADGHIEYDVPSVGSDASGLRFASLLEKIGRTRENDLREIMIKMLAYAVWQEHSDAIMVRAILGSAHFPTVAEFEHGNRETYQFLYAYDFSLHRR